MNVIPLRDFVLVQPEALEEQTKGGIYVPKTAKNNRYRGLVLAVGPGRITDQGARIPVRVDVGARVIYSKHNMAQGVIDANDENGPILVPEMDLEAVIAE